MRTTLRKAENDMPKRTDIKSILIIGAGPIVIGQACEFDYSGAPACKALKEEGYRVILVNSNPATIMTDPETADATYVEPITPEIVEKIIAGKVDRFLSGGVLSEQAFVKDPDNSISDLIGESIHRLGENIVVGRFVRFAIGEADNHIAASA